MAETNNVGKAAPSIQPSQGIPDSLQEVLFEGPIPGQSLTNPTDERKPWEQAPRYTQLNDVRQKIFMDLLEPERLRSLQTLLSNKVPVNAIAISLLKEGFQTGAINPDMMLNLLEPTMYMIMAIAEKSGIEPVIESENTIDEDVDEEAINNISRESKAPSRGRIPPDGNFNKATVRNIQPQSVGRDIKKQLDELDNEKLQQSLLERRKTPSRESLLGKGE